MDATKQYMVRTFYRRDEPHGAQTWHSRDTHFDYRYQADAAMHAPFPPQEWRRTLHLHGAEIDTASPSTQG